MQVRVGIAPAGHKPCDVCGNLIAQGHIRVHAMVDLSNAAMRGSRYFHLDCALKSRPDVARDGLVYRHTDVALLRAQLPTIEAFAPQLVTEIRAIVERDDYAHSLRAPIVVRPLGDDPTVLALIAQLEAKPGDRSTLAVLADVLQSADDPRGELIALQLELDRASPPLDAALCGRRDDLLEALAPQPKRIVVPSWGIGFVRSLTLRVDHDDLPDAVEALRDDSSRIVESVTLRIAHGCRVDQLHAALPRSVRALHAYGDLASVPRLVATTPALGTLGLDGTNWDGQLEHDSLAMLRLAGCVRDVLATVGPAQVPKLVHLTVSRTIGDPAGLDLVAEVAGSHLLHSITGLVLEVGEFAEDDLDTLVAANPKLRSIRIVADRVPANARERLATIARRVHVITRRVHRQM